jgi:hypothetical protein
VMTDAEPDNIERLGVVFMVSFGWRGVASFARSGSQAPVANCRSHYLMRALFVWVGISPPFPSGTHFGRLGLCFTSRAIAPGFLAMPLQFTLYPMWVGRLQTQAASFDTGTRAYLAPACAVVEFSERLAIAACGASLGVHGSKRDVGFFHVASARL